MMSCTVHEKLEQRPEALNTVGIHVSRAIIPSVTYVFMRERQSCIASGFIRVNCYILSH